MILTTAIVVSLVNFAHQLGIKVKLHWVRDLTVGLLALGLITPAYAENVRAVADRVASLRAERPVFMMSWRQAKRSLLSHPAPIPLPKLGPADWSVCVAEIYLDVESGKVLDVDVREAPSSSVARALRSAVLEWKFMKAEASTARAVLSIPVAFYPIRKPDGAEELRAVD